jgi:hypothetical protein
MRGVVLAWGGAFSRQFAARIWRAYVQDFYGVVSDFWK